MTECPDCSHPAHAHDQWGCATPVIGEQGKRVWCNCPKRRPDFAEETTP